MLYIDPNTSTATLYVPRSMTELPSKGSWSLMLKSTAMRTATIVPITAITHMRLYHVVKVAVNGLMRGEYSYLLLCNGGQVASGLLMVQADCVVEQNDVNVKYQQYDE